MAADVKLAPFHALPAGKVGNGIHGPFAEMGGFHAQGPENFGLAEIPDRPATDPLDNFRKKQVVAVAVEVFLARAEVKLLLAADQFQGLLAGIVVAVGNGTPP